MSPKSKRVVIMIAIFVEVLSGVYFLVVHANNLPVFTVGIISVVAGLVLGMFAVAGN